MRQDDKTLPSQGEKTSAQGAGDVGMQGEI